MDKNEITAAADRVLLRLDNMSDEELFAALEENSNGPIAHAVNGIEDNFVRYVSSMSNDYLSNRYELWASFWLLQGGAYEHTVDFELYLNLSQTADACNDSEYMLAA
ncbi:MAG: hypothetical protein AB2672_17020 [Candidatus Thiodiazotropha endolucinida]